MPVLELNTKNALVDQKGFVICLTYFNRGANVINIQLDSYAGSLTVGIGFYKCSNTCLVYLYLDNNSFLVSKGERSNYWIFICIRFDILTKELALGIDNKMVFQRKLEDQQSEFLDKVQNVNIWWENKHLGLKRPEKFTLFNIHSITQPVHNYTCGAPGDIFSWEVKNWVNRGADDMKQNLKVTTSKESTHKTCQTSHQVFALPNLKFHDALTFCENINGRVYYEDTVYEELIILENNRDKNKIFFWLPYADEKEEGIFNNVYSGLESGNITSKFFPNQPNGGRAENCLTWRLNSGGIWDTSCFDSYVSLCQVPKNASYLVLRGLCPQSQTERLYTSGNRNGKFIWNGQSLAMIEYTNDLWMLNNYLTNVWATSYVSYDSLLIGTNPWIIHNDKKCSNQDYTANLSLRLGYV